MTSPAKAKIIVGGPRTCRGWGGNAGCNINTDACFDTCVSQGSSRPILGRVIRRADIVAAFTHTVSLCGNRRSMLRCDARSVARRGSGGYGPQPSIEWIFYGKKLTLLGRRTCFIQYRKVLWTMAKKRSSTFLRKNASALSFCSHQCKILEHHPAFYMCPNSFHQ